MILQQLIEVNPARRMDFTRRTELDCQPKGFERTKDQSDFRRGFSFFQADNPVPANASPFGQFRLAQAEPLPLRPHSSRKFPHVSYLHGTVMPVSANDDKNKMRPSGDIVICSRSATNLSDCISLAQERNLGTSQRADHPTLIRSIAAATSATRNLTALPILK